MLYFKDELKRLKNFEHETISMAWYRYEYEQQLIFQRGLFATNPHPYANFNDEYPLLILETMNHDWR